MIKFIKDWWAVGICISVLLCIISFAWYTVDRDEKRDNVTRYYAGPIIQKGIEPPTSGYKSHSDAIYFIVLQDVESKGYIRVNVVVPIYYKYNIGDTIGFDLTQREMWNYNNGNHLK